MRYRFLLVAALLSAAPALADFGQYQSHSLDGQSLVVVSDLGELTIRPVDDAA